MSNVKEQIAELLVREISADAVVEMLLPKLKFDDPCKELEHGYEYARNTLKDKVFRLINGR